jgi:hypothetical protein
VLLMGIPQTGARPPGRRSDASHARLQRPDLAGLPQLRACACTADY